MSAIGQKRSETSGMTANGAPFTGPVAVWVANLRGPSLEVWHDDRPASFKFGRIILGYASITADEAKLPLAELAVKYPCPKEALEAHHAA